MKQKITKWRKDGVKQGYHMGTDKEAIAKKQRYMIEKKKDIQNKKNKCTDKITDEKNFGASPTEEADKAADNWEWQRRKSNKMEDELEESDMDDNTLLLRRFGRKNHPQTGETTSEEASDLLFKGSQYKKEPKLRLKR